jgi:hypothetical protein
MKTFLTQQLLLIVTALLLSSSLGQEAESLLDRIDENDAHTATVDQVSSKKPNRDDVRLQFNMTPSTYACVLVHFSG